MARDHARLFVRIWADPDWKSLSSGQQLTFIKLVSSSDLSWCGVHPMLPVRLAQLSSDTSERKVRADLDGLAGRRFVVVDESTAEVLVRSYVRHDGLLKQPNVTKAMVKALEATHSDALRSAVREELARAFREDSEAKGWATIRSERPELFDQIKANPPVNPLPNPSVNPSRKAG